MKIVAIDPGPKESAMLIWRDREVGIPKILPNAEVREWLVRNEWLLDPNVILAIEMIACYGMPVGAETFETCLFIGRLQEIWSKNNRPLKLVYRRDVKMFLCGTMKAKDGNIRQALIDRYGVVGTKKNPGPLYGVSSHLWSALAVAVTAENAAVGEPPTTAAKPYPTGEGFTLKEGCQIYEQLEFLKQVSRRKRI